MNCDEIIRRLRSMANPDSVQGMARYRINPETALGVSIPSLRRLATEVGHDHGTAGELWESDIHEARILASMVEIRSLVTEDQAESRVRDFNSRDLCDQCCNNLLSHFHFVSKKALEWIRRPEEFVKRAGFVFMALMARISVHDKKADNGGFAPFLQAIRREAADNRHYVKKAVNQALRQMGKRNLVLNAKAVVTAMTLAQTNSKSTKWIAADARREPIQSALLTRLAAKGD